jgi:hypothetical protein
MKRFVSVGLALAVLATVGCTSAMAQQTMPPSDYTRVSTLVSLPDVLPGLGTLYVDPKPAGPFLAYDRQGNVVSAVYMIPIKDITAHKAFNNLTAAKEKVDHVYMYYNAGHPGVAEPHYHVVVWYVSPEQAAALNQQP